VHLGLAPPRLALAKKIAAAATRKHAEGTNDTGANQIPTNSPRHGGDNAMQFVNDPSKIPPPAAWLSCALRHMVNDREAHAGGNTYVNLSLRSDFLIQ
jgi:hypothetical protein